MSVPRYIPADASPFERFQVYDQVAHITRGDGIVTENNGFYITVVYARNKLVQHYDAEWFRSHPRYLFHRIIL
jgi:hypothetical protein